MIKTRLIKLLSHAKKYVVYQVLLQWISLAAQIILIYCLSSVTAKVFYSACEENFITQGFQPLFSSGFVIVRLVLILFCSLLRAVLDYVKGRTSFKASVDVKRILRNHIYEKLLRLGSSYREKVHSSEIVQLASEGVEQLEIYFGSYLSQFFYSLICPLTLFAVLSFVSLKASLILLICVPLIPLSIVAVMKIAKKLLGKYWGLYAELGDSFLENLQGLTTLKIYQADEQHAKEMDAESEKFRRITMKVLTMQLNSTSVMDIMAYGGAAVGMIVAITQFAAGTIHLQGALMIVLLAADFFLPLRILGSYFHVAMNGMAASDKIFALLDLPEPEEKSTYLPDNISEIIFENVDFSYNSNRKILNKINLSVKKGIYSFAGVSGSGKSTITQLLMGRNNNYKGSIKILSTGKNEAFELRQINEASLMKGFVYVNHENYLFKGTIRENLLIAKPEAKQSELEAVLKQVDLYDFVKAAGGFNFELEEGAANLSGGQKQRLCLARALLLNPKVYIFDEATSSIDSETEAKIMQVIKELSKEKIIILISHRLANLQGSKCIYFLQNGKITESGTHSKLVKENGKYTELFAKQKKLEKAAFSKRSVKKGGKNE